MGVALAMGVHGLAQAAVACNPDGNQAQMNVCASETFIAAGRCESADPAVVAKQFFARHRAFYCKETKGLRDDVAPSLYGLLQTHYRCAAAGEVCHLDYEPWLGAQDGEIAGPVSFIAGAVSGARVPVTMRYRFELGGEPAVPREVTVQMEKADGPPCWRVADLVTPVGDSLVGRYRGKP